MGRPNDLLQEVERLMRTLDEAQPSKAVELC